MAGASVDVLREANRGIYERTRCQEVGDPWGKKAN